MVYPIHLFQVSRYTFQIDWSDGTSDAYRLSDLQQRCPCQFCQKGQIKEVDPLVLAQKIDVCGRFGIKIEFTSGCNHGVYSFEYLKNECSEK
jgi:DUF971 family protein